MKKAINVLILTIIIAVSNGCVHAPQKTALDTRADRASAIHSMSRTLSNSSIEYKGWYLCNQGKTNLRLTLNDRSASNLSAIFAFDAPDGVSGSFTMQGYYQQGSSKMVLKGKEWISRPNNYATVDLSGSISEDKTEISGTIDTPGCSIFKVQKTKTNTPNLDLEYEKIATTQDGQCKIYIPVKIIADSYDKEDDGCNGRNIHIQAAIVKPPMKWSGKCGKDGYATGESGTLFSEYSVTLDTSYSQPYHGRMRIDGSVVKGHFRGKFFFNIFDRNPDHFGGGCPAHSKTTYVYDGSEFDNQQAIDEFANPELKKARLALEKKNRDEAERRQKEYEQKQRKLESEFVSLLGSRDPQAMYLAAGKYAREGNNDRAKQLYEAITNRFPSSPFAIKASDQLTAILQSDRERANAVQLETNAKVRAYNACKIEYNSCLSRTNGKGSCYRDCDSFLR